MGLHVTTLSSLMAGEGVGLSSRAKVGVGLGSWRLGMRNLLRASGLGKWGSTLAASFCSLKFSSSLLFTGEPEGTSLSGLGPCSRVGVASGWPLATGTELLSTTWPLMLLGGGKGCWVLLVRVARGDGCWLVRVARGEGCWVLLVRVARGEGCWVLLARVIGGEL